jgi:hypothetical protein
LIAQLFLGSNYLQLFYYFSYSLPVLFLALASIAAALLDGLDDRTAWSAAVLLVVAATVPWVLLSFGLPLLLPRTFGQHLAIAGTALVLAVAAAAVRRRTASLAASIALGTMFVSSFAASPYLDMVSDRRDSGRLEMDVYRTTLEFVRTMPRIAEVPGEMLFWYTNRPGTILDSVQSTFLWGYSRMQGQTRDRGLPYLGDGELAKLQKPDVRWLTLLAEEEAQLSAGREALSAHGVAWRSAGRRVLRSGTYALYVEVLELRRDGDLARGADPAGTMSYSSI